MPCPLTARGSPDLYSPPTRLKMGQNVFAHGCFTGTGNNVRHRRARYVSTGIPKETKAHRETQVRVTSPLPSLSSLPIKITAAFITGHFQEAIPVSFPGARCSSQCPKRICRDEKGRGGTDCGDSDIHGRLPSRASLFCELELDDWWDDEREGALGDSSHLRGSKRV